MDLRGLAANDEDAIKQIAAISMETAYDGVLQDAVVSEAVEAWYDADAFADYREGEDMHFVVAEIDDEPVGFIQSHVIEEFGKGRILWIHVHPEYRGIGVGSELLEAAIEQLHERGVQPVTAAVLAEYGPGIAFYEQQGFVRFSERLVTIGGQEFRELLFREETSDPVSLELHATDTGEELYVDLGETDRGSTGPFCAVYRDPHRNNRWGWFCTSCESLSTAMDPMGRIQCSDCGNTRKPVRWDAAYL